MTLSLRLAVVALMLLTALALGMIGFQLVRPVGVIAPAPQGAVAPAVQYGYLVAAHPIPAGTLVREEDITVKFVPPGETPTDVIADSPETQRNLHGALIRSYIDAGQPIRPVDILRPRDRGFLASVLGNGTRAISIGVDPVTGVSGLVWPGDRVDLILTQQIDQQPASKRVLSETVLADVRVIGVDQEIVQGGPMGSTVAGKLARTVTLEVTPEQAERITVAEQLGRLALTIRAARDQLDPILALSTTTFGADVSPALSRASGRSVQVIEGDKRHDVIFQ